MATSNTGVIVKRSFVTAIPPYLEAGELAYSYLSNTFFIGSPSSDGVLNVGGRFYTQTIDAATSNNTANTLVKRDANGQFYGAVLNNINGLTPGYYGGTTAIPIIQVSANGLITSVSNSVFSQPDTANLVNGIYKLSLGADGKLTFPDSTLQNTAFTGTAIDQVARNLANNSSSGSAVDQYARNTANSSITGSAIDQYARNTANTDVTNISLVGSSVGSSTQIPVIGYAANGRIISAGVTSPQIGTGSVRGVLQLSDSTSSTLNATGANAATPLAVKTTYDYAQDSFNQANSASTLAQAAFDKANTGVSTSSDQYARDTANAATNNITVLQGVNTTQNNSITVLQGVNTTQNTDISILYGTNLTQNNSITTIQGVDVTQNSRIASADDLARSAFGQANAAFNQANVGATFVNAGGTITGNVLITRDLSITGNLFVLGNATTINTSSLSVQDSLIILGVGNYSSDILDIGFAGHYNAGTNAHTGIIRDASQKEFYVFDGYTPELTSNNNININDPSFSKANLNAQVFKGNLIATNVVVNNLDLYNYVTSSFAKANTVGTLAQAGFDAANTAAANTVYGQGVNNTQNTNITSVNTYASNAYDKANSANVLAQAAFDKANTAAAGSVDQYARDTANTAASNITIIQGVNTTQNTNITSVNTIASSAYDKANSANVLAQAAFNVANTDVTNISLAGSSVGSSTQIPVIGYAANGRIISAGVASPQTATGSAKGVVELSDSVSSTSGVSGANAATPLAVKTTYDYAQAAYNAANTNASNITVIQGVDLTQNTNITNVNTFAGSAYDKANTADARAQAAFDVANTAVAVNTDQYARDTANTASANTIYTQGVDLTQNTNISAVNTFAGSAYDKANTADTKAQASFDSANTNASNITVIQGVNTTQNTNISSVNTFAGSAYDKANTASSNTIYTQGVDETQNTNISSVNTFAGAAYDRANSANVLAQAAYDKANTSITADQYARDTANTASANTIYTQGVDLTQNTNITNVNTFAGSAYDKANTADVKAQAAFDKANTGTSSSVDQYARDTANTASANTIYTQGVYVTQNAAISVIQGVDATQNTNINTVTVLAQAAFDKANTGITSSTDQYARDTANSATTNITIIQGVNTTQNTNISSANNYAASAFNQANAAFTAANNRVLKTGDTITGSLNVNSNISSTKPNTGSLLVIGGVGVSDSIYVGNRVGFSNTSNVSMVYQYYNAATNSLDTVFG